MTVEPFPQWLRPPQGGFVAEDLDRLIDLPPHSELIDGSLVFRSPQAEIHMLVITLLENALRQLAPTHLRVRRGMTVTLGRDQRPEPDIVAVHADRDGGLELTTYQADDVVLAVEVVSADSRTRDRERNPNCMHGLASRTSGASRTSTGDRSSTSMNSTPPQRHTRSPEFITSDCG
ncbi:Uma2 family endonuclease [Nocardia sp. NPDC004604]|uniref:Uma2 family endonuclease n=1 Tax=Nocardia sp. NPDC004604 TaxID=3157013 RepID=UPI0033B0E22A